METIGVRELRQNASKYLARVEAGEEFDVTSHGRSVARLVPVPVAARSRQSLIDAGILTPAQRPRKVTDAVPRVVRGRGLSAILDDMRNEQ